MIVAEPSRRPRVGSSTSVFTCTPTITGPRATGCSTRESSTAESLVGPVVAMVAVAGQ